MKSFKRMVTGCVLLLVSMFLTVHMLMPGTDTKQQEAAHGTIQEEAMSTHASTDFIIGIQLQRLY